MFSLGQDIWHRRMGEGKGRWSHEGKILPMLPRLNLPHNLASTPEFIVYFYLLEEGMQSTPVFLPWELHERYKKAIKPWLHHLLALGCATSLPLLTADPGEGGRAEGWYWSAYNLGGKVGFSEPQGSQQRSSVHLSKPAEKGLYDVF